VFNLEEITTLIASHNDC